MPDVIAFGDSVLKGVISENSKYKICSNNFAEICGKTFGIDIENGGKFGNTIIRGGKIIEKNLEKIKNNSLLKYVIFEFGGNDCDFNWEEISQNPYKPHFPNSDIKTFTQTYTSLINKIKEMGKIPVLLSLPPIDAEKYFKKISHNLNSDNILKWLGGKVQHIADWHERYNLEVFNIALNNNVKVIDITSRMLEQPDYSAFLCEDGIHPNEAGHKIIAESINEYIKKHNITL
ncbi:MAG: SGNH/GDSL hydrolase family protein [Clostridia bacterium]|nr:SGNH/GDSL hydrolase family protein [Clostridia bacterium]